MTPTGSDTDTSSSLDVSTLSDPTSHLLSFGNLSELSQDCPSKLTPFLPEAFSVDKETHAQHQYQLQEECCPTGDGGHVIGDGGHVTGDSDHVTGDGGHLTPHNSSPQKLLCMVHTPSLL